MRFLVLGRANRSNTDALVLLSVSLFSSNLSLNLRSSGMNRWHDCNNVMLLWERKWAMQARQACHQWHYSWKAFVNAMRLPYLWWKNVNSCQLYSTLHSPVCTYWLLTFNLWSNTRPFGSCSPTRRTSISLRWWMAKKNLHGATLKRGYQPPQRAVFPSLLIISNRPPCSGAGEHLRCWDDST
jgi:hypothetical protein